MAAYAALASLMNTMEDIKIRPFLSTTFDEEGIESLGETVGFLLDFIERHTCGGVRKEVEDLESRIASAAYKAEDAIESHIVDILAENGEAENGVSLQEMMRRKPTKLPLSSVICELQKVTEEARKVKKEGRFKDRTPIVASSSRPVSAGKISMVGFEDYLKQLMHSLTWQPSQRKIIPITGMGGIEDEEIIVSRLIQLWVAEGFLRPNDSQTLEDVANGYLKDLVSRNLILVNRWGSNGEMRACNIHDLIRELCLSIAEKEQCLWVMKLVGNPRAINRKRRICTGFQYDDFTCFNMRFLDIPFSFSLSPAHIPKRLFLLWNLQTVIIKGGNKEQLTKPSQVWEMIQLRHIKVAKLCLPDPPRSDGADLLLPNLQTLCWAIDFRLSEEVCKRIPNVKKLGLKYNQRNRSDSSSYYCLQNLGRLQKLESFKLIFEPDPFNEFKFTQEISWRPIVLNMTFPSSLKKLTLSGGIRLYWEDLKMIGSLQNLEVLKLYNEAVTGSEWNPVELQFQRLKFLEIKSYDLIRWNANEFHFPVLEKLVFIWVLGMDEIPSGIGNIPTLRTIRVYNCSNSLALSAVKILEEQEGLGNEDLQVEVVFGMFESDRWMENEFREMVEQAGGFTSQNLHIEREI